jgi:Cu+-exporting ATPase
MIKITLKISGMHCTSCSLRIDGDLEELDGVQSAYTNFARGESEVEYDESKVSAVQLADVIRKAGYAVLA